MDKPLYDQVHAVFLEACELIPAERGPFLDRVAARDPVVHAEVVALLDHVSAEEPFEAAPPADDPLRLNGVVFEGRYRIDRFVAEGGFSYVYRAWHLGLEQPVAVKLFKQVMSADTRRDLHASFVREGALLARLNQKTAAVVRAFDVGTWRDARDRPVTYLVLEWLEGEPLSTLIRRERRPWTPAEVLDRLAPLADALMVAHEETIAHRDIKPENIFVVGEGAARGIKLLDFGMAKEAALHSRGFDSTSSAISPFTVRYAAPEQVSQAHGPTGPRTDVFALALVCAELLAARPPYDEGSNREILVQVLDPDRRPTPNTLGAAVPRAVEASFRAALALDPARRPADVATWWAGLQRAVRGRSLLQRLRRR